MSETKPPSDLSARVKTGIPLAAGIILLLFTPTYIIGLIVLVVAFIGAQELTGMLSAKSGKAETVTLPEWLLPGTAVLMGLGALAGETGLHGALLLSALGWIFYELVFTPKSELSKLSTLGFGMFGMVWAVWSVLHITLIKTLPDGTALLFYLLLVISFSDIFAYFGGKRFGKSLLAPNISPKKTWEGSFFGIVGGGLVGAVFGELTMSMFWLYGFVLAMLLAVVGQLGDLVESKIKRLCDVKDSGTLLPGHGGILDRIDGHMLAAPVFYYLLQLG
ncbi:MAG: phosphatidate cytidylyltransferase [SAR324 cluster bacterium]|nr:phosphatidate cytidylyltransferase [SAR324 cluster bacterium]MBL7034995.1 phosphatidate cytidylyltransferase [SAR324 cluster bacterium]